MLVRFLYVGQRVLDDLVGIGDLASFVVGVFSQRIRGLCLHRLNAQLFGRQVQPGKQVVHLFGRRIAGKRPLRLFYVLRKVILDGILARRSAL